MMDLASMQPRKRNALYMHVIEQNEVELNQRALADKFKYSS